MPERRLGVNISLKAKDDASDKIGKVSGALGKMAGIAGGIVIAKGLAAIGGAISDMAGEALNAVGDIQNLTIALETMIARQAVGAGAFENVRAAIGNVTPNVEALKDELRDLSLISPFQRKMIQNVFRFNMAFGATTEIAKEQTRAQLDTAAALGLTNEQFNRMSFNLAQALLAGDLTVTNLRQLKLVGLDLAAVFRDELGQSVEEVEAALMSGKMTVEEVSSAFAMWADKNFGGAAERMSKTLTGLKSSFVDLFEYTAVDLLTPAVEKITSALGKLFDEIRGLLDSGVVKALGNMLADFVGTAIDGLSGLYNRGKQFLGNFVSILAGTAQSAGTNAKRIINSYKNIPPSLDAVAFEAGERFNSAFNDKMAVAAANAFNWGVDIVFQLAQGIIEGAATALTYAMNAINALLTSWLAPGSPPKVAPQIDEWGAAAFTEFLKGFQNAEWGVFDNLQRILESAMGTLVEVGEMGEDAVGGAMAGISELLSGAISQFSKTGTVAQSVFDRLKEAGGKFGNEIAELARKYFDLQKATNAYEKSVKRLEQAQKEEAAAADHYDKVKDKLEELIATRAPKSAVRAARAELKAASERQTQAEKEREEAEKANAAAEKRMKLLKDQVNWQKKLVEQLQKMAKWMYQPPTEEEGGAGGAGGRAGGAGGRAGGGGAGPTLPPLPAPSFEAIEDLGGPGGLPKVFEDLKKKIEKKIADLRANVDEEITKMTESWTNLKNTLSTWAEDAGLSDLQETFSDVIPDDLVVKIGQVIGWLVTFGAAWKILGFIVGLVLSPFKSLFSVLGKVAGAIGTVITFLAGINPIFIAIIGVIAAVVLAWETNFLGIRDWALTTLRPFLLSIPGWFSNLVEGIIGFIKDLPNKAQKWFQEMGSKIQEKVDTFVSGVKETINTFAQTISTKWEEMKTTVSEKWQSIKETINTKVTEFKTAVEEKINTFVSNITAKWDELWGEAARLFSLIKTTIEGKVTTLKETAEGIFNDLKTAIEDIWEDIKTAVKEKAQDVYDYVETKIGDALGYVEGLATSFYNAGAAILTNLWDGLKSKWQDIKNWIEDKAGFLADIWPGSEPKLFTSPLRGLDKAGAAIFKNILSGMKSEFPDFMNEFSSMTGAIYSGIGAGGTGIGMASPPTMIRIDNMNVYAEDASDLVDQLQELVIEGRGI